jgi:hypothetical protein
MFLLFDLFDIIGESLHTILFGHLLQAKEVFAPKPYFVMTLVAECQIQTNIRGFHIFDGV